MHPSEAINGDLRTRGHESSYLAEGASEPFDEAPSGSIDGVPSGFYTKPLGETTNGVSMSSGMGKENQRVKHLDQRTILETVG